MKQKITIFKYGNLFKYTLINNNMNYKISDNSYCINVETGMPAWLVQEHDQYYSPDKKEDGATFEIVSEPYESLIDDGTIYVYETFINVKSSLTGNIYRVLFNEQ